MNDPIDSDGGRLVSRFLRRRPSQARSRALVTAVVTAFEEVLGRVDGSDEVTVDAVLERAGVGVSSFYQYFGDKRSLLGAFVGHLTERNFRRMVQALEAARHPTIQQVIEHLASELLQTYCERPAVTRAAMGTIGRLGLLREIVIERDRFADELTRVAQRFYPATPRADLALSLRAMCDMAMGLVASELERGRSPDRERLMRDVQWIGVAFLADRHGEPIVLDPH